MARRVERVWPNGCEGATGPRDPPDGSKLVLHRKMQKLYVAVKELELSNSIGWSECTKQTGKFLIKRVFKILPWGSKLRSSSFERFIFVEGDFSVGPCYQDLRNPTNRQKIEVC